ncbi:P-loop containing nucleoside triphosphate hydrolase protein [Aspergillus similis]
MINVALVVGICGGVPYPSSGEEIFLGDVIISDSVVQYDFGRQYPGGFERKTGVRDTLGRPNKEIRTLLAGLRAKRARRDLQAKMLQHLQAIQESQSDWHRPSSADDVLFEAQYQHKHYGPTSPSQVYRCRRHAENYSPSIHIGTVASADTMMKSGEHRDLLVKSEDVIGFETEGAGVWDNTPCIIIKGHGKPMQQQLEQRLPKLSWTNKYHIPLDLSAVPAIEEFIGREDDLTRLWDYLQPRNPQTRRVAVLHGLGGIGKTQLAIHFARKHKDDFTAIFWLNGKNQSSMLSSLSTCLSQIQDQPGNTKTINEEEAEQRARQVLQWLAKPDNTRWLIIIDNVDQYAPTKEHHNRLTEVGKSFPVQKLIEKDATQLLLQTSGFSAKDIAQMGAEQDLNNLVKQLDGLSLAIIIAGAFMRQTGANITEYLELYRTSWFELQSQSRPTHHYQQGNIVQTWMITYQEIQKHDAIAAELLLLLACFDNQDIWFELIQCGLNCSNPPPWLELALSSKLAFKTRVKVLIGFSLLETKQQEGSYTIHPVVQDWCCHIAASNNIENQLYKLTLISVGYMVPSKDDRDYARLQQRLLPHANHLLQIDRDSWQDDEIKSSKAWHYLGSLYKDQGKLKEADEICQQALAGYKKALGPDHPSTLDTVHILGSVYKDQGKLKEAEEMYQQALAGKEKALGLDHPSTLDTVNNLGNVYKNQGKLKEAEGMYQQALAGYKKALVNNLGNLYSNQGKLKEAEEMYQQALAGKVKAQGLDHPSTLNTVNNLGNLYSNQGKLKEAEEITITLTQAMKLRALYSHSQEDHDLNEWSLK